MTYCYLTKKICKTNDELKQFYAKYAGLTDSNRKNVFLAWS